jgi:hypothetical protein
MPTSQQPADRVQRVVLAAAVSGGVVLDPAADLVDGVEADFDHMERLQHPHSAGRVACSAVA